MFIGARYALENNLKNVAFVRTRIENIESLFGNFEISEIWLTFPDPQMNKERKRLTSTGFLYRYRNLLKPDGIIHLKTDSEFLFSYTCALVHLNHFKIMAMADDLYHPEHTTRLSYEVLKLQTYYEKQWTQRGIPIKYLSFRLNDNEYFSEPDERFEKDSYRSFGRGATITK
jgi:tRNA (guanine-N7-)-methyltransferase